VATAHIWIRGANVSIDILLWIPQRQAAKSTILRKLVDQILIANRVIHDHLAVFGVAPPAGRHDSSHYWSWLYHGLQKCFFKQLCIFLKPSGVSTSNPIDESSSIA
jgi:hypothetical protein